MSLAGQQSEHAPGQRRDQRAGHGPARIVDPCLSLRCDREHDLVEDRPAVSLDLLSERTVDSDSDSDSSSGHGT